MTEEHLETTDRQRRVRRLAGLLVGGAVVASIAFAVPAMASQGTIAQSAATITTATSTSSSSTALEAPVTTTEATTTTAPVETTTTTAPPSPEEQLKAKLAAMTPEEAAAFKAFVTPPPPTTTTTAPKPTPTTTAPKPAAPKPQAQSSGPANGFLACVRQRESHGQYGINTGNGYYGAYQFSQSTWNNTASHAGRGDLVGRAPSSVSPADQDAMAAHLYGWQGRSPWAGPGC